MAGWATPAGERWRWAGLVIVAAIALLVGCVVLQGQFLGPSGLTNDRRAQLLYPVLNILMVGVALFLAFFSALHCNALIEARAHLVRRRGFFAHLATELALLPAIPERATRGTGYRDPLRLTMLAQALASDLLHPSNDAVLVAALLRLHGSVGRYNDLVLTNALVLADGQSREVDATATEYWRAAQADAAEVRALLDDRGIRPPPSAIPSRASGSP